jgi:hypothetical protein
MNGLLQDLRYALRQLRNSPGFLAVVVLSLALRIGANSTIFSVLNAMLYQTPPYEHAERLVLPYDLFSLIGKLGLKLTLIGVAIGIGLALALTRLIAGFLVGVKPADPATYAVVAVVLVGVGLLAPAFPPRDKGRPHGGVAS